MTLAPASGTSLRHVAGGVLLSGANSFITSVAAAEQVRMFTCALDPRVMFGSARDLRRIADSRKGLVWSPPPHNVL